MRNFSSTAIGILTVALMMASLSLMSFSASPVFAASSDPDQYEVIVRGTATAYNIDEALPFPHTVYHRGDNPPIVVAERIGSGAVVAGGIAATCRYETRWNSPSNPKPYLDVLLGNAFQWMVPGAENVLWYEGYDVYSDTDVCSELISALENKGYTVVGDSTEPIDSDLLEPYNILVIPQLHLGDPDEGGDPTLLDNSDVQAIVDFVENDGGGLLIMEQSDHEFSEARHYPLVQNKILEALNFSWRFQSDEVQDDTNNWEAAKSQPIVDIDPTTSIGSAYQSATGSTEIGLWHICSLVRAGVPSPEHQILLKVPPSAGFGEAGENVTFEVKIINIGTEEDTYSITVEDELGWQISVSKDEIILGSNENENIQIEVTILEDLTEKVGDWVTLKVSGVSGAEENARVRAVSVIPLAEPPYPIARPEATFYWFSSCTLIVEPPAVPIICGTETGYGEDGMPREPWPMLYGKGEYPPVGAAALIGNGRVTAIGSGGILRTRPVDQYGDVSLAAHELAPLMVRWLIDWGDPSEHKFLFYYTPKGAFHGSANLSGWLDTVENELGFELDIQKVVTITSELLEGYDVLQVNTARPSMITGSEAQAIADWVENGGGLLLMEAGEGEGVGGNPSSSNKILEALKCSIIFNGDEIFDDDHWTKDGPWFPQVYILDPRGENPEFDVWFPDYAVSTSMPDMVEEGYGESVTFTFTVTNTGTENTTYNIEVTEKTARGWSFTVEPENVEVVVGDSVGVVITVSIPETEEEYLRTDWLVTATDQNQTFITAEREFRAVAEKPAAEELPLGLIGAIAVVVIVAIIGYVAAKRRSRPKRAAAPPALLAI